jgi:cyanate permease
MPLSLLAMVGVGWGFMMISNNSNAIIQSQVPDELRGRVMGVYTLVFFGSMPIGSLLAGTLAQQISEPLTVMLGASLLMLLAVATWIFLPAIRRQE